MIAVLALIAAIITMCSGSAVAGETVIQGQVSLPPAKPVAPVPARYQQKTGVVTQPEPSAAVIYLEGPFSTDGNAQSLQTVKQRGYQFSPALLPIQKGTAIEFPNEDDDYHHVFSYSKAREFDVGRYRKTEQPPPIKFDKAGVVKVGCEIHDHMRAIILVLDTPHFIKTDSEGKYRLTLVGVPDGKYMLKAWINEKTVREQPVVIVNGAAIEANFSN
jgi:plastocyanin